MSLALLPLMDISLLIQNESELTIYFGATALCVRGSYRFLDEYSVSPAVSPTDSGVCAVQPQRHSPLFRGVEGVKR